jgi:predicted transcriptional regulator
VSAQVALSHVAHDEPTERLRFMRSVDQGLADVGAGRVTPHEEIVAEMRLRFGEADGE